MKKSERVGNAIGLLIGYAIVIIVTSILLLILAWGVRLAYRLLVAA